MLISHECASQLADFFDAIFNQNWILAEETQSHIKRLEGEADEIKRCVRLSLPKSLFLPVPRSDILRVVTAQDKVANCAKDIAGIVIGRKMHFPEELKASFKAYLSRSIDSSAQAVNVVDQLDALIRSSFKGPKATTVEKMIHDLDGIESETDRMQIEVRTLLFDLEKTLPPIDIIFMYQIIESVGNIADYASNVGGYVELMLSH